jgi:hypothetical protein
MKTENNYAIMTSQARERFLTYDQEAMIRKFGLSADQEFLYLSFAGAPCRIRRTDGTLFCQENGIFQEGGFNESLSVYDILCCPTEHPSLSGRWESLSSLGGIIGAGHSSSSMMDRYTSDFSGKAEQLDRACLRLGGRPASTGDVSYILPVFDFFPTWFQFWDGDEEFPASIRFLWDSNTFQFLHYETLWYIMNHILDRLASIL